MAQNTCNLLNILLFQKNAYNIPIEVLSNDWKFHKKSQTNDKNIVSIFVLATAFEKTRPR